MEQSEAGNLQKQIDEIEALSSIYEDEWCVIDEAARVFCIRVVDELEHPKWTVCLQVMLPPEYPSSAPPVYQLNASWLRGQECTALSNSLEEIYLAVCGVLASCVYLNVEVKVKLLLQELYQNKKIANATHNIYAYRIHCEDKQTFLQDCEDDGETAAGGRLLHLLQILDARNVLVVVSRWYGGILLGPDRFKHINNCARNILVDEGYAELAGEGSRTSIKKKKPKNKRGK
ncbi:protein IMPACT [Chiloscyllium plagiosum]|uniref:protein IMPACT n=1 Tax=Chiloscyllium plagiosum TaxID=36176 RepID=UPI001CB816CD|nr:protein IMPACT [Chiloscyllium plagiosum]